MKCSKCDQASVIKQGNQMLCEKHYRFGQMRQSARRGGKVVPTHEQLERMVNENLNCVDCGQTMNWRSKNGKSTVASLQHYRDGSLAIVCLSCNSRHASMAGDSYRDMPKDHKHCPSCQKAKPTNEFSADNGRSGPIKIKSICKKCSNEKVKEWKEKNRMKYNEYQREFREKKKSDAMLAERAK